MRAPKFVAIGPLVVIIGMYASCTTGGDGEPSEIATVPDASTGASPDASVDAQADPCANVVLNPTCDDFLEVESPLPNGTCPSGTCPVTPTIPDTQCLKQHWPQCCSSGGYPYSVDSCDAGGPVDASMDAPNDVTSDAADE